MKDKLFGLRIGLLFFASLSACEMRAKGWVVVENPMMKVQQGTRNASGWLVLHNSSAGPANLTLSSTAITNTTTSNDLGASLLFSLGGAPAPLLELSNVESGSNLQIQLTASNVWEAGESTATLLTNGASFTGVRLASWQWPFAISLVFPQAGTNEMIYQPGHSLSLVLSNADPVTYPVHWTVLAAGMVVAEGQTLIAPSSEAIAGSLNPDAVFSGAGGYWYKDRIQSGELCLRWDSSQPSRQKIIPVSFRLPPRPGLAEAATFVEAIATVFLLGLGAAGSWALSLTLPSVRRRGALKSQIRSLAERTHNLSAQVDSSLRVVLRVQRVRLLNLLLNGSAWSPATVGTLNEVQAGVANLDRQLTQVERIDRMYDAVSVMRTELIAPTTLVMVDDNCTQASRILRATSLTDEDLKSADGLLKDAETRLNRIGQPDDSLASIIARRVKFINEQITDPASDTNSILRTGQGGVIRARLPGLLSHPLFDPKFEQAANVIVDVYQKLDSKSRKLEIVCQYLQLWANLQAGERLERIKGLDPDFMEALELEGLLSLQRASRLLLEMQEGVYADEVSAELKASPAQPGQSEPHASIEIGQTQPRLFEPVSFRVAFRKLSINDAVARDEFTYEWNFGDGLTENGQSWTVWHFYKEVERRTITVKIFAGKDGTFVGALQGNIIVEAEQDKHWLSDETWAETCRVALALLAPLLALVAGAKEKLLQGDIFTAAIAVFLMGFTANTIKDLLTQSVPVAAAKSG